MAPAEPQAREHFASEAAAELSPEQEPTAADPLDQPTPGMAPPEARTELEVSQDLAHLVACGELAVALVRVRRNPGFKPDLDRMGRRAGKVGRIFGRRFHARLASSSLFEVLGLVADIAGDFLEDSLKEAQAAARPGAQTVSGAVSS